MYSYSAEQHITLLTYCVAAIHHNDCMYVAHHLMLLGHQFIPLLPPSLTSVNFVDLVPVLRRSGTQCFMQQMSTQQSQLIQSLNTAHGTHDSLTSTAYYCTPCLRKKTVQISFCQNVVIFPPILIIFGRKMANRRKLCEVYSFFISINLHHHTTVLNADI